VFLGWRQFRQNENKPAAQAKLGMTGKQIGDLVESKLSKG
jgi:hypothetical protein